MRQASFEKKKNKMPDRTYIMQEEKAMPVHKPMQLILNLSWSSNKQQLRR